MNKKILEFIKKETIMCISLLLAVISAFFVQPDGKYMDYIDWHTLMLLFSLMAVMAGLQKLGVFREIGVKLLSHTKNTRQLTFVLVFLPFIFSMFITNDVALITFVPFAIVVLRLAEEERLLVPVVILQTIAANLGSMLTPIGNPQNLYLFGQSKMSLVQFLILMLPYTAVSAVCILLSVFFLKKKELKPIDFEDNSHISKVSVILYGILFTLCLLCVSKVLDVKILILIVIIFLLIFDRHVFASVDYTLLITFIGFFIFIGNMGRVPVFKDFINGLVVGNEIIVSVFSSQLLSNVPTALLLSGFSDNWSALIIGTNIGGLGTLIASMASLISYKQIARNYPGERVRYLIWFTFSNLLMLGIMLFVVHFI